MFLLCRSIWVIKQRHENTTFKFYCLYFEEFGKGVDDVRAFGR